MVLSHYRTNIRFGARNELEYRMKLIRGLAAAAMGASLVVIGLSIIKPQDKAANQMQEVFNSGMQDSFDAGILDPDNKFISISSIKYPLSDFYPVINPELATQKSFQYDADGLRRFVYIKRKDYIDSPL